jgi:PAS domain S-box-containing protein
MFAVLMLFQWLAGIAAAIWISPRAWHGSESQTHLHVWLAVVLGGAIASLPIYLAIRHAGRVYTRYTIAIAQVLFSTLFIDLTSGRIETHFHVFGSLAFLAVYGDWFVLIPATIVVALDHFGRGLFLPESVYGVLVASPWRWLEHSAWVIFEDTILIFSCRQSVFELQRVALRTAELDDRTKELELAVQSNRSILDAALDAVVTTDAEDRIIDLNPQAERLFDLPRAKALGRSLAETMIPAGLREQHRQGIAQYFQAGESRFLNRRIEIIAQTESRGTFSVELSVVPIRSGEQVRFSAFIRDITDRLRSEEAMVVAKEAAIGADRAKSAFLAT